MGLITVISIYYLRGSGKVEDNPEGGWHTISIHKNVSRYWVEENNLVACSVQCNNGPCVIAISSTQPDKISTFQTKSARIPIALGVQGGKIHSSPKLPFIDLRFLTA